MSNKKGGKHAEKKPRRGKPFKIAAISLAALLVVLVGAGAILLNKIQNPQALFTPPTVVKTPVPPMPGEETPDPGLAVDNLPATSIDTEPTEEPPPEYDFGQDRVNILLLGQDSSNERIEAGMNFRTDSMILATLNLETHDVDLISIPRDSYVRINGGNQRTKINAAFVYGGGAKKNGYQYAMDTVSWALGGIRIDYYVGYGMQAVKDVVDAMGGIDYDVDIAFTMNGRRTEKGMQHLDGQKALDYARYRGSGGGDLDRADRQQRIILAMFEQLKSTDQIKNIPAIYSAVMEQIDTNLDLLQIASLAYWGRNLKADKLDRHTLEGYGLMIGNTWYYIVNQGKKQELVKEVFGVDISIPEGEDYATIKAMAQEIGMRVSELIGLVTTVREGINTGAITDPAAQSALITGEAALMSEKDSEVKNALEVLRPFANYVPAATADPNAPGYGDGQTGGQTGLGSLGGSSGTGADTGVGGLGGSGGE